jgi:hypothetical protein
VCGLKKKTVEANVPPVDVGKVIRRSYVGRREGDEVLAVAVRTPINHQLF